MARDITIKKIEILSNQKHTLKKITFEKSDKNGNRKTQAHEVYDRGDAATIFLYNLKKRTVILTRQFRPPTYLNGNPTGMLVETCAGKLDGDSPEDCVKREAEEETGYRVNNLKKIFEVYMSAGGLTELLHFFTATYKDEDKISEGGGLQSEDEEIEVWELTFEKAYAMLMSGEIRDAKTIILLQYAKTQGLFPEL